LNTLRIEKHVSRLKHNTVIDASRHIASDFKLNRS